MIRLAFSFVLGALAAAALAACKHPRDPPRPAGLPKAAMWVGGADGGAFVLCRETSKTEARCTTWSESGSVWMKGRFHFVGSKPANLGIVTAYEGVDGERIVLANGGRLDVVAPPRPGGVPPDAVWSGGPQCGAFMACTKRAGRRFYCTVYDEDDGIVRSRGAYELRGDEDAGPRSNADLEDSCAAKEWDISVRGGGLLVYAGGDAG